MILIWGTDSEVVDLGQVEIKRCDTCGQERPFHLYLQYTWSHLYFVFGKVEQKQYTKACSICNRGAELDAAEVEKELTKKPIPFLRESGCMLGMWLILGFALAIVLFLKFG